MSNIYLKVPNINELHYRQEWMQDPKTMAYNAGYDINLKGYNKETGTIIKTDEEILTWYNNWINKEPDKYFAYIYDSEIIEPIGEIYYYLNNGIHSMGIVIQDKYRRKGYSYKALLELEKIAFEKNNISELSDIIPDNRISAIKAFTKAGFISKELEGDIKQYIITKEMYYKKIEVEKVIKTPKDLLKLMSEFDYKWMDKNGNFHDEITPNMYEEYSLMTPEEVLKYKCGICVDQTEFERDWFNKHNFKHKVMTIQIIRKDTAPGHTFLIYQDNNKYYWFENAWYDERGIQEYNSYEELIEDIKYKFIAQNNIQDNEMHNLEIFESLKYPYHLSYEEMDEYKKNKSNT